MSGAVSTELLAASFLIAETCPDSMKAFMECKKKNMDPEACLKHGSLVTNCANEVVKKIRSEANSNYAFTVLSSCLNNNGTDLSKCKNELNALHAAFEKK